MSLVFGLVVLALLLYALHTVTRANPHTLAIVLKTGGGLGALALAGLLGLRGRLDIAVPLGHHRAGSARLAAVEHGELRFAHAEKRRTGLAGTFGVSGNGARS